MSSFYCEHCGTAILDTPGGGAVTECEHYKIEKQSKKTDKILKALLDEKVMLKIAKEASLNQRIQMLVWEYMQLPKLKRNSVELATAIIEDCKNTYMTIEQIEK